MTRRKLLIANLGPAAAGVAARPGVAAVSASVRGRRRAACGVQLRRCRCPGQRMDLRLDAASSARIVAPPAPCWRLRRAAGVRAGHTSSPMASASPMNAACDSTGAWLYVNGDCQAQLPFPRATSEAVHDFGARDPDGFAFDGEGGVWVACVNATASSASSWAAHPRRVGAGADRGRRGVLQCRGRPPSRRARRNAALEEHRQRRRSLKTVYLGNLAGDDPVLQVADRRGGAGAVALLIFCAPWSLTRSTY